MDDHELHHQEDLPLLMEVTYNHSKCSKSADLPNTQNHQMMDHFGGEINGLNDTNRLMRSRFNGLHTKEAERDHYKFLNEMKIRLNVDSQKLIDLEARITCNERKKVKELLK